MGFSDWLEDRLAQEEVSQSGDIQSANVPTRMARQWAKMRSLGRLKYTLLYGVLGVGSPPAIVFALRYHSTYSPARLAAHLVAFPLIGLAWAIVMWEIYRRKCEPSRSTMPHDA